MDIKRKDNSEKKLRIMISFEEGGENGGPYMSHKRICECLSDRYDFIPLIVPAGRLGIVNLKLQKELRRQIRQANPDIVHIHGLQLVGYHLMTAAKKENKPVVLAVRGFSGEAIKFSKWKKMIVRCCEIATLRKADVVYCVSNYVKRQRFVSRNAKRMYGTVYNLSHITDSQKKMDFRKKLGISDDDIVIVSTGRITEEKGFRLLCDVILKWHPENEVKFVIVGDGDYLVTFKQRIKENNLNEQVFFEGYQDDVPKILNECDIFVLCTLHETLSNSILEAQKEGLPVVATNVGGIPEIIQNGCNGILFEKGNINQIIEGLKLLSEDSRLRTEMGMYGKRIIEEKFSEKIVMHQIVEMYLMVCKK